MTLISRWRLRGNALDSVGSNNGTAFNVTWTTGPTGAGASFAGNTGSYISVPDSNSFSSTDQRFTVSMLAYHPNASYSMFIVTKGQSGNYEWALSSQTYRINALKYTMGGASGYSSLGSTNALTSQKWSHIVASWDNNYPILYVNGVPVPSTIYNTATPVPTNGIAPVVMGKRADNVAPFLGRLADVCYRNKSMSNAQVKNEYLFLKGVFS